MGRRRHGYSVAVKNGTSGGSRKRADVHPQGVGRIRSAPSSLTAALAIGSYNMLCMDISWLGIPEMSSTEIDVVCQ